MNIKHCVKFTLGIIIIPIVSFYVLIPLFTFILIDLLLPIIPVSENTPILFSLMVGLAIVPVGFIVGLTERLLCKKKRAFIISLACMFISTLWCLYKVKYYMIAGKSYWLLEIILGIIFLFIFAFLGGGLIKGKQLSTSKTSDQAIITG